MEGGRRCAGARGDGPVAAVVVDEQLPRRQPGPRAAVRGRGPRAQSGRADNKRETTASLSTGLREHVE